MHHLEIEEISVMGRANKGSVCTTINNPYLYFELDKDGYKKYFFDNKG